MVSKPRFVDAVQKEITSFYSTSYFTFLFDKLFIDCVHIEESAWPTTWFCINGIHEEIRKI